MDSPFINNLLNPESRPEPNLTSQEIIKRHLQNQGVSTNTYSYQGFDFLIPVIYGFNSVSVSFSWMYYIPSEKVNVFGIDNQSGYIISLSFIF